MNDILKAVQEITQCKFDKPTVIDKINEKLKNKNSNLFIRIMANIRYYRYESIIMNRIKLIGG